MSRDVRIGNREFACFPRVSGDEPWSVKLEVEEVEFSPRERG